jgi:hypothetical protein
VRDEPNTRGPGEDLLRSEAPREGSLPSPEPVKPCQSGVLSVLTRHQLHNHTGPPSGCRVHARRPSSRSEGDGHRAPSGALVQQLPDRRPADRARSRVQYTPPGSRGGRLECSSTFQPPV